MKTNQHSSSIEPEKLKPVLHAKIERMDHEQLLLLDRVLLQIEAESQAARLAEAFDEDAMQGKFNRLAGLIRDFRAQNRYS